MNAAALILRRSRGLDRSVRQIRRRILRAHFLEEPDRVVPLLSAADVFLLPSAQESFVSRRLARKRDSEQE